MFCRNRKSKFPLTITDAIKNNKKFREKKWGLTESRCQKILLVQLFSESKQASLSFKWSMSIRLFYPQDNKPDNTHGGSYKKNRKGNISFVTHLDNEIIFVWRKTLGLHDRKWRCIAEDKL